MEGKKWETFYNYNKTISVEAYLGNEHGVHATKFPLVYEELKDIPDDIIFRVSTSYLDSAYIRISEKIDSIKANNESFTKIMETIYTGTLFKNRNTMCHSNLATASSVLTFLKYVKVKTTINEVIPGIVNYDKFLSYLSNKTLASITNDTELTIYNEIISLKNTDIQSLLEAINNLFDTPFKKNALLLLKATIYGLEDTYYQKHERKDLILTRKNI